MEQILQLLQSKRLIFFIFLILIFCFVIYVSTIVSSDTKNQNSHKKLLKLEQGTKYIPDRLLVRFKEGYSPDDIMETAKKKSVLQKLLDAGVEKQERVYKDIDGPMKNYYALFLAKGVTLEQAGKQLEKMEEIETIEGDAVIKIDISPNDPSYGSRLWNMSKIGMEDAWDIATGSKNIIVAVLDTGIDYTHEDLPSDIINGEDTSWNSGDRDSMDENGHGTHLAGVIGAVANNGKGVTGMNWNIRLMAVQVLYWNGSGSKLEVARGMNYAVDNGARVLNLSLGYKERCLSLFQDAIDYAIRKNVIVVVSAGNDGEDAAGQVPANCNNVITVGASTQSDERASFSNFGSVVDVAAPGVKIYSTYSTRSRSLGGLKYFEWEGTSMAAPHVTGAAALLLSLNPYLTPQQVEDCIVRNADSISTDKPIGKRLNVERLVSDSACTVSRATPTPTPLATPTLTPVVGLPGDPGYQCILPPGTANKKALQMINLICTPRN